MILTDSVRQEEFIAIKKRKIKHEQVSAQYQASFLIKQLLNLRLFK